MAQWGLGYAVPLRIGRGTGVAHQRREYQAMSNQFSRSAPGKEALGAFHGAEGGLTSSARLQETESAHVLEGMKEDWTTSSRLQENRKVRVFNDTDREISEEVQE